MKSGKKGASTFVEKSRIVARTAKQKLIRNLKTKIVTVKTNTRL
jgi:hypothetical protein